MSGEITSSLFPRIGLGREASPIHLFRLVSRCMPMSFALITQAAEVLGWLDPSPLSKALFSYFYEVSTLVCNPPCVVENWFGIADVLNALPLLYHLGNWPMAIASLAAQRVPGALCINMLHIGGRSSCQGCGSLPYGAAFGPHL